MPSSKYLIAEQVKRILVGGNAGQASKYDIREIYKLAEQFLNSALKMDYFKTTLAMGETAPEGLAMATYDNIPVTTYRNVARAILPAMPQRLPRGMGYYAFGPMSLTNDRNILTSQFIPVPMGMGVLLASQPMISGLLGQVGYEPHGLELIFTTDITKPPNNITSIWGKLIVLDLSQYSEWDALPIAPEMEAQCVQSIVQMLSGEPDTNNVDDPIAVKSKQQSA